MRRDRPRADGIQRLRQLPDVIREVSNSLPEEIDLSFMPNSGKPTL